MTTFSAVCIFLSASGSEARFLLKHGDEQGWVQDCIHVKSCETTALHMSLSPFSAISFCLNIMFSIFYHNVTAFFVRSTSLGRSKGLCPTGLCGGPSGLVSALDLFFFQAGLVEELKEVRFHRGIRTFSPYFPSGFLTFETAPLQSSPDCSLLLVLKAEGTPELTCFSCLHMV